MNYFDSNRKNLTLGNPINLIATQGICLYKKIMTVNMKVIGFPYEIHFSYCPLKHQLDFSYLNRNNSWKIQDVWHI
jgi:hypothetical protein